MKKLLWVSALATAAGLMSGMAAAQAVGNVISSTPVLKRVTEPRSTCANDANGQQQCRTEMVTEDRNIGFKVVYEYAGHQHTVQLPFPPGATIPLEVQVSVQGASSPEPAMPSYYAAQPQVVERVVRDQVYVDSPYYYGYGPYYPGYYNSWYPYLGLAVGYGLGYYYGGYGYGYGYRGGYGHGGRYGHGGNGGHAGGGHRGR